MHLLIGLHKPDHWSLQVKSFYLFTVLCAIIRAWSLARKGLVAKSRINLARFQEFGTGFLFHLTRLVSQNGKATCGEITTQPVLISDLQ